LNSRAARSCAISFSMSIKAPSGFAPQGES
jgi:hypothetical protein